MVNKDKYACLLKYVYIDRSRGVGVGVISCSLTPLEICEEKMLIYKS